MIGYLRGTIIYLYTDYCLHDVQGVATASSSRI